MQLSARHSPIQVTCIDIGSFSISRATDVHGKTGWVGDSRRLNTYHKVPDEHDTRRSRAQWRMHADASGGCAVWHLRTELESCSIAEKTAHTLDQRF